MKLRNFKDEDEKLRQKIDARNGLESYAYGLKNTMSDDKKIGDKLTAEDKQTINDAIKATTEWLEKNQSAEKDEFEAKKERTRNNCTSNYVKIISSR